jgi:hypothetical protein
MALRNPSANVVREQPTSDRKGVSRSSSDTAERKRRNQMLGEFIAEYEAEFGVITDEELSAVEREWQALHSTQEASSPSSGPTAGSSPP